MATDPPIESLGGIQLLRIIGSGAYGRVWLGLDGLRSPVAVKVIDRQLLQAAAFDREEQALRLLRERLGSHPNVVELHHIGSQDTRLFYSMELADPQDEESPGPTDGYRPTTLESLLASGVPLPVDECVDICDQLLAGVEYLHEHDVIHRDLKPTNVLKVNGKWKLADFGLMTEANAEVTTMGSLGYLAPNGPLGKSSDLYSVGKILYGMLTGLRVSEFPSVAKGYLRSQDKARFGKLLSVVNRACHHLPQQRFQQTNDFRKALARASDLAGIRRRRRIKAAGVALTIGLTGYAIGILSQDPPPLGPGSSLEFKTVSIDMLGLNTGEEAIVYDHVGGRTLRAIIHHEATWERKDGGNGHMYRSIMVTPDVDQWGVYDAEMIAESMGGYLVSLNTPEENEWVFAELASDRALWRSWVRPITLANATYNQWKKVNSGRPDWIARLHYSIQPAEKLWGSDSRSRQEMMGPPVITGPSTLDSPPFDEDAKSYYLDYLQADWGEYNPLQTRPAMMPCATGPLIGVSWANNFARWKDGTRVDSSSWDPFFLSWRTANGTDRLQFPEKEGFAYVVHGSTAPTSTWWQTQWKNRLARERRNTYNSFIVEIPVR